MEHGTNGGYSKGCKCDLCRAAHSAYQREWAARNKDKVAADRSRRWREQSTERREARNAYMRDYMAARPEQRARKNETRAAWRARDGNWEREREQLYIAWRRNPGKRALIDRRALLKNKYGLTLEDYDDMLAAQGGVCAICEREQVGMKYHVDHCHETGKVRGILCSNCNTGLGMFSENEETMFHAIQYLFDARREE